MEPYNTKQLGILLQRGNLRSEKFESDKLECKLQKLRTEVYHHDSFPVLVNPTTFTPFLIERTALAFIKDFGNYTNSQGTFIALIEAVSSEILNTHSVEKAPLFNEQKLSAVFTSVMRFFSFDSANEVSHFYSLFETFCTQLALYSEEQHAVIDELQDLNILAGEKITDLLFINFLLVNSRRAGLPPAVHYLFSVIVHFHAAVRLGLSSLAARPFFGCESFALDIVAYGLKSEHMIDLNMAIETINSIIHESASAIGQPTLNELNALDPGIQTQGCSITV